MSDDVSKLPAPPKMTKQECDELAGIIAFFYQKSKGKIDWGTREALFLDKSLSEASFWLKTYHDTNCNLPTLHLKQRITKKDS